MAFEEVVVLRGVEEGLGASEFNEFGEVGGALSGVFELLVAGFCDLGGGERADGECRVFLREQIALVPVDFDPWWVSQDEIEAAAAGEEVDEFEFPVEEFALGGEAADEGEARGGGAEFVDVDDGGVELEVGLLDFDGVAGEIDEEGGEFALGCGGWGEAWGMAEQQADLGEELLAGGKQCGLFDGPEPEGAPVVQRELEAGIGAVGVEDFGGPAFVLLVGGRGSGIVDWGSRMGR